MINDIECPICLINLAEYYTECNHKYCINCLCRIKKCALCCKKLLKSETCNLIKFEKKNNLKILLDTNIIVNSHGNSELFEQRSVYNNDNVFNFNDYYDSTLNLFIIQACIIVGIRLYSFFKN